MYQVLLWSEGSERNLLQPDFEKDIAAAMDTQAVRKLNDYKYYWKQFSECINSIAKTYKNTNITKGNGNLYQFINYCTLGATIENDVISKVNTMGMYAEDNNWWTNVKTIFEEIVDNNGVNEGEKYSEFIKTIKTPVKSGYELPKIRFIETFNGKVWSSDQKTWLSGYSLITAVLESSSSPSINIAFPLKYGMKGNNSDTTNLIYQTQMLLNNNLASDLKDMLSLKIDSDYGQRTTALVKLYQKQNNAKEISGEVNEVMYNSLKSGSWKLSKPGDGKYVLRGLGSGAYYEWVSTDPSQWERINKSRIDMVNKAKELLTYHNGDPVHYYWGGKYMDKYGYNINWGTISKVSSADNWYTGKNVPLGLICSGFTNWTAFKITGKNIGEGTDAQMSNLVKISDTELKPGDLGFTDSGGHVGMYIGKNSSGDMLFIHAAGSDHGTPVRYITDKSGKKLYTDVQTIDELRKFNTSYITGKVTISINNKTGSEAYLNKSAKFVINKGAGEETVNPYYIKVMKKSNGTIDKYVYTDIISKKEYIATIKELPVKVTNPKTNFSKFYRIKVRFIDD